MEIKIIKFLQSARNPFYDFVFTVISELASYKGFLICFAIFFILTLIYYKQNKNFKNFALFNVFFVSTYGLAVLTNTILKIIINRSRPYVVDASIVDVLHASGQSMPSGHTLSATIICFFIFFSVYYFSKNKNLKIILGAFLSTFIILVMVSRMYLGQHYISDVIVGFVLAFVFSLLSVIIFIKLDKRINYDNDRKINKEKTEK